MKLQYVSDLHLEFSDNWSFLKKNPIKVSGDVLILAGDIGYLGDENYSKHPFWDWTSENYKQGYIFNNEQLGFDYGKCFLLE